MRNVIFGLIGGLLALAITTSIARRAGRRSEAGQLRFGKFMWAMGFACLLLAALPVVSTMLGHDRQFWAKAALVTCFCIGAVYCICEAAFVRGRFDDQGIEFSTPWTGSKRERWADLEGVQYNFWGSWHTLTFRSGSRIRISSYLSGNQLVLERIRRLASGDAPR